MCSLNYLREILILLNLSFLKRVNSSVPLPISVCVCVELVLFCSSVSQFMYTVHLFFKKMIYFSLQI